MIQTQREYAYARKLVATYTTCVAKQRQHLQDDGFTPEEVTTGLEPLLSFIAQIQDEIDLYARTGEG